MKSIFPVFALSALLVLTAATVPNQYEEAMRAAIEQLFEDHSAESLQASANTFDRIANKETDKWHPRYYGAYAHVMLCIKTQENAIKDKYLDAALERLNAAKALSPKNSEILALEGFIHMMRIPIDPATRGPQYSGMSMAALHQAIALDADNPRAHLLLADMQYGTAQFFGSDTSEACATLAKAISLFDSQPKSGGLDPAWGKGWAMESKAQKKCE